MESEDDVIGADEEEGEGEEEEEVEDDEDVGAMGESYLSRGDDDYDDEDDDDEEVSALMTLICPPLGPIHIGHTI